MNHLLVRAYLAVKREEGQTFVEYAMIAAIIGVALTAALLFLEGGLDTKFRAIEAAL